MDASSRKPYRLGLDLGTNSLGWFLVWLDRPSERWRPIGLGPGGVRVFPDGRDPQSKTSNAVDRRMARGARKRRDRFADRYFGRRTELLNALVRHGLMPTDEKDRKVLETLDPYELRAKALDGPRPAHHVGRALFHLNQRRGFLSNRKAEKKEDNKGAIKQASTKLKEAMQAESARTLGEFLWHRHQKRESVRARNVASGPKAAYDFYPTRDLLHAEFDELWNAQAAHHTCITAQAREEIEHIIFFQRDLKPQPVGKCTLDPAKVPLADDPEGYRCSWAHPMAQRFRILQEARNLEVRETGKSGRRLTKEEGDKVALALLQNNKVSFDKLRTLLKLPDEARFNLESERRDHLKGDELAEKLANKNLFGKAWRGFAPERQIAIVEKLLGEADEKRLTEWLQSECGVGAKTAEKIADAHLPESHCRLGLRAIKQLLPVMEKELDADGRSGVNYPEAARRIYADHSKQPTGEILDRLPYYGEWLPDAVVGDSDERSTKEKRFGQFPNPTVHIGLGQLRRLVNALIKDFGPPEQVVIELARDLKRSQDEKRDEDARQAKNQKKNEERKAKLAEIGIVNVSGADLLKMRLWEELGELVKPCPFSGRPISLTQLMSAEVEVEHLIPYSDSLDNSPANKTVCFTLANRLKGKQTPYEAFGSTPEWPAIAGRAASLPGNKRWRFAPDARERLNRDGRDFLDRQLMETRWLSRLAHQYVSAVCDPRQVWVVTGQHTSLIRGKWGLNTLLPDHNFTTAKNRADHRHHAIDALVTTVTDRSLLQKIARAYDNERDKIDVPLPWPTLREDLEAALKRMIVSHKPDHGVQGKLHEDTAYGLVKNEEKDGKGKSLGNLVYRKALASLTENEIDRIRDRRLRDMVRSHVDAAAKNGMPLAKALLEFRDTVRDPHIKHGLKRVRLVKAEKPEYLVPIKDPSTGKIYKSYSAGKNVFLDIIELPDGSWTGEAATFFQANQPTHALQWPAKFPGARLLMRLFKDDLVRINYEGESKVVRVVRLEPSANRVRLAEHKETGVLQERHDNPDDPFRWIFGQYDRLKEWKAEHVRVDELGRVWRVQPKPLTTN
ncbi:MAG: type II CRISPR RNA-guided endonuclease Cas9 [Pseudorhodoplanes sp.]|nr:type II CRISPR RNA-guided endonuclease Cas9 [Pseudorhodoplanes sp.]